MDFRKYLLDQCLSIRENNLGTVIICLYIDNTMVVGNEKVINGFKKELSKYFNTKEEGRITKYIGCMVKLYDGGLYLHQNNLMKKSKESLERK